MEKLDKPQWKDYGPVIVWITDLEEIFDVFKDSDSVELIADDVKYESLDELVRECKNHDTSNMTITSRTPYLSITLNKHEARLYASSSSTLETGLFYKADQILKRCERKPRLLYQSSWLFIGGITAPNLFLLPPLESYGYMHLLVMILTFSWLPYAAFIGIRCHSIIRPIRRMDNPGFLRRNADHLVVAVMSLFLGAILTAVGPRIVEKIWPSDTQMDSRREPNPPS